MSGLNQHDIRVFGNPYEERNSQYVVPGGTAVDNEMVIARMKEVIFQPGCDIKNLVLYFVKKLCLADMKCKNIRISECANVEIPAGVTGTESIKINGCEQVLFGNGFYCDGMVDIQDVKNLVICSKDKVDIAKSYVIGDKTYQHWYECEKLRKAYQRGQNVMDANRIIEMNRLRRMGIYTNKKEK